MNKYLVTSKVVTEQGKRLQVSTAIDRGNNNLDAEATYKEIEKAVIKSAEEANNTKITEIIITGIFKL